MVLENVLISFFYMYPFFFSFLTSNQRETLITLSSKYFPNLFSTISIALILFHIIIINYLDYYMGHFTRLTVSILSPIYLPLGSQSNNLKT